MCLHPEEIPPIPDETVRVASAAFPKGNLYMRLRDELGVFYQDEDFAALYPQRGQPAQAVQGRIDWKYACNLIMKLFKKPESDKKLNSFRNNMHYDRALKVLSLRESEHLNCAIVVILV